MYLINARKEGDHNRANDPSYSGAAGILQKPSFRKPIRSQRCLVLADGFIEGPEDLCVVTFEYENETHIVQFKFHELCDKGYIDCETSSRNKNKVFRLI